MRKTARPVVWEGGRFKPGPRPNQPVPWRVQLRLDLRCVGCIFPPCNSRKAAEPIKRRRSVALQPVPWRVQLRLDLRCVGCIFPPCNSRKAAEPIKRRRSVALQPVPWRTFGNLDPLYRPRTIASSQQVGAISSQCSRINMTVASMPPIHPAVALRLDLPLAGRPRDFPETRS